MIRLIASMTLALVGSVARASAETITFGTAPTLAATRDCQSGLDSAYGPLQLLDESGLRVRLQNFYGNRYACDHEVAMPVDGMSGLWTPMDLGTGLEPMSIWFSDGGWLSVDSMAGVDLLGFVVNYHDIGIVDPTHCNARVGTRNSNGFVDGFNICHGVDRFVSFADYGLFNVRRFAVSWFVYNDTDRDPRLQLLAVDVPSQGEDALRLIPEPSVPVLLGLAFAAWQRRRR